MIRATWTLLLLAGTALCGTDSPPPIAIRDARIVTVSGPVLAKGTVLIREGLIEAVGTNVTIPPEAWVMDGEGLTVYPGLIDAMSSWGLPPEPPQAPRPAPSAQNPPARGPEDRPLNNSFLKAADIVNPSDKRIEQARSVGFTTAVIFPRSGIFCGQGSIVNLAGAGARQMVVRASAGQKIAFLSRDYGDDFPMSLMGTMAYIRQVALDADHYRRANEAYERNPKGSRRPEYDRTLDGWLESPRILLPAERSVEIDRMLRFGAELKTRTVLYGAHDGYRAADLLAKSGTPVLVSLKWPERNRNADPNSEESLRVLELREKAPSTPAAFAKAGVRFAFYSDGTERPSSLMKAVRRAIVAGLSQEAAVRAMTLSAAEIYGVDDRLGSIDKGKIANLVVTSGDLFQENTKVKCVFIDGNKITPAPDTAEEESK